MSELDRFFGIVVSVFFRDVDGYLSPHVHARYAGRWASVAVDGGKVLGGGLPPPALRLLRQWLEENRDLVAGAWERARRGEAVDKLNTGFGKRCRRRG